ncbi:hypothetical protein J3458_000066 [Metarhizium acridum]|uniref:uncharacterized protein n=1 Tax=Metarhizium acridum TaxID=92637 RepID=UPI001C6B310F|nr:hypothetical protein J3458_000066 [Metarhizium acridum]
MYQMSAIARTCGHRQCVGQSAGQAVRSVSSVQEGPVWHVGGICNLDWCRVELHNEGEGTEFGGVRGRDGGVPKTMIVDGDFCNEDLERRQVSALVQSDAGLGPRSPISSKKWLELAGA